MGFDLGRAVDAMIQPLRVLVANTVTRAIVRAVDDSKKFQELQVEMLKGELRSDVERVEEYGFTSHPLVGAEAVAVCVGGRREHAVVIATGDRRYRLANLESGEVAVYNNTGAKILIKASGDIEVTPAAGKQLQLVGDMTISGALEVAGNASIGGDADVTGDVTAAEVTGGGKVLSTHKHGVSGSVQTAPGSVTFIPASSTEAPS